MWWEGLRVTRPSGADVISACHLSDLPSSLNVNKRSRCFIGTQLHCSGFFNKIYRAWKWLQLGKQGLQWNRGEEGYERLERPWEVCWLIGTDCLEMTPVSISQWEGEHFKHFFKAQLSQCIDLCECFNRLLISRRSLMGDITPNREAKYEYWYVNSANKSC